MNAPAATDYAVVIPTVGRSSLHRLLRSLAAQDGPGPGELVVVDDRRHGAPPLRTRPPGCPTRVLRGYGAGPAAARNRGWRAARARWVVFLDDDVWLPAGWAAALAADLAAGAPRVAGCQGRIVVPLPAGRGATDQERGVAGLRTAAWATADMAYRRDVLDVLGGFDERFRRAYREDADLALRARRAGHHLVVGTRHVVHPARAGDRWASLRAQAGNADDALLRRLHGPTWRVDAQVPRGRLPAHAATVAVAGLATAAALTGRRAPATLGAAGYLALTAEFTAHRLTGGPRAGQPGWARELTTMLLTSPPLPFAAVGHRAVGWWRHRHAGPWPRPVRAVLFDRDGTLVHDVPYNGDPALVAPMPGAADALARLRAAGIRTGVVSNQSGVGRGLLTRAQVAAVDAEVAARLGPFDTWQVCPHAPEDHCRCRKPAPGLLHRALRRLRLPPEECVVVGDIATDLAAAAAAGCRAVLVPTAATRADEVAAAPLVADSLATAADLVLGASAGYPTRERPLAARR